MKLGYLHFIRRERVKIADLKEVVRNIKENIKGLETELDLLEKIKEKEINQDIVEYFKVRIYQITYHNLTELYNTVEGLEGEIYYTEGLIKGLSI